MAAVAETVVLVLTAWTAVAMVVAVAVGHALRRLEPVPVRAHYQHRVVDLRRAR